jgi:hypothetical protein
MKYEISAMKSLFAVAAVLLAGSLSGCGYNPAYKNGSIVDEAASAFMEGFIPTRTQITNAARQPGYVAGRVLAR